MMLRTAAALGTFYTWFFHTLPFLAWSTRLPTPVRVLIVVVVDYAFDVRPCSRHSVAQGPRGVRRSTACV